MAELLSRWKTRWKQRWKRFKRFLKRNLTPLWAMRFSYQVISFIIAVGMVFFVASYAFAKSYDSRPLTFVKGFTITAHTGAFEAQGNTMEALETAMEHGVGAAEIDVRRRLDGTVVMGSDIITTNNDGIELTTVLERLQDEPLQLYLNIKDMKVLPELHDLLFYYGMEQRVYLLGIEIYQAENVAENCPDIPFYINYIPSRIKIFSDDYQQKIIDLLEKSGAVGIHCHHQNASRTLSEVLHTHGYKLSVWTVDSQYEMKRALMNKPDNIITRKVENLQEIIAHWGK